MNEDFSQVNYDEYLPGTMDTADGNSTNVYFKRDPFTDEVIAYDSTGRKITPTCSLSSEARIRRDSLCLHRVHR